MAAGNSPRSLSFLFPLLALLFFASGATSLVYQVAWLRSLLLIFGSTAFAVSTILASFMAGLAAGSYAVGRWIDRIGRPVAVYGALELGIGLYALAVPYLLGAVEPVYRWIWTSLHPPLYVFGLVRFILCFAVLFVPTAMMGGTLPALTRFCAGLPRSLVASVGGLYGINTLGAFFGTVMSGFLLLPAIGLSSTIALAAAANMIIGLGALGLHSVQRSAARAPVPERELSALDPPTGTAAAGANPGHSAREKVLPSQGSVVIVAFAVTGFAALMLEVAWTRVLALVIGPSVYAFSLMLAAFLGGLGLGSVVFAWAITRFRWTGLRPFVGLSAAAGIMTFGTLLAFHRLPHLYATLFHRWAAGATGAAGSGPEPGVLFAIGLLLSGAVMLPPTLVMGGLFPAAVHGFGLSRDAAGRGVGSIYAANGAGAIAGAFAAGFVAIPLFGLQPTVLLAAWLYLAVAGGIAWLTYRGGRARWAVPAAVAGLAVLMAWSAPRWNRLLMSSGIYHYAAQYGEAATAVEFNRQATEAFDELFYREGLVATVLVAQDRRVYGQLGEDSVPSVVLISNGKIDASSLADMPTQILSAHIPLLLHPEPRRALVIGLASGTTAGSALRHDLESLDVVEIEPAVAEAAEYFNFVNGRPVEDARTRLTVADGRTFLLLTDRTFDIIISEPSNPWITGVSNLFTVEFFELVKERLAEAGIFCQWVQMYGMSPENVAVLLRSFVSVFPETLVFNTIQYTDLLLIGALDPIRIDPQEVERRLARPEVKRDLARVDVEDAAQLLARGRLGRKEIVELVAGDEKLNTDDNAHIEFTAPLDLHRSTRGANERIIAAFARGLAPYLESHDPQTSDDFLRRLGKAYQTLGYHAEAVATRRRLEARRLETEGRETS